MSTLSLQEQEEESILPQQFSKNFVIMPTIAQLNERFRNIEKQLFSRKIDSLDFNNKIFFLKNKTEIIRLGLNDLVKKYNKTIKKSKNQIERTSSTIKRKNRNQSFGGRR
tara:strand:+ start:1954 stop:2283 length:330 start_codon:yes stop_codon:yes gene_type:complete